MCPFKVALILFLESTWIQIIIDYSWETKAWHQWQKPGENRWISEFDRMLVKDYEILRCANADRKVTNNLWSDVMNECLLKELDNV